MLFKQSVYEAMHATEAEGAPSPENFRKAAKKMAELIENDIPFKPQRTPDGTDMPFYWFKL